MLIVDDLACARKDCQDFDSFVRQPITDAVRPLDEFANGSDFKLGDDSAGLRVLRYLT